MNEIFDSGVDDLEEELRKYAENASGDNVLAVLQAGADAFTNDLLKLPSPRSNISKPGYTHLLDSFANKVDQTEKGVIVGWGKYYGPIVEKRKPHLHPLWESNKQKYYQIMEQKLTEV